MKPEVKINVAIVDDHFSARDGYRYLLNRMSMIGTVRTFEESKKLKGEMKYTPFDLILMDIELKKENGIDLCNQIKKNYPKVKVLLVSAYASKEYIVNAYENSADGYLNKDAGSKIVKQAIETIMIKDQRFFDDQTIKLIHSINEEKRKGIVVPHGVLTTREIEILKLICEGYSNEVLASLAGIGVNTISTHRQKIMKKLNAHRSAEIIAYAVKNGIYKPPVIKSK